MAATMPIPGPPGLPIVGNIADINPALPLESFARISKQYGEIFQLHLGGRNPIFLCSHELLNEVCDETRFTKIVAGPLEQVRNGVGDGLFTAHPGEHNWAVAHRILMPAFGPLAIKDMYDEMHDISTQLVVKWARFGGHEKIDVTSDFTRLTLDSIALCAMGTRFNSFYKDDLHPFVHAMVGLLAESGARANRPQFANYFMRSAQQQYDADIALCRKVAGDLLEQRLANPEDKKDLLNAMIKGVDAKTGEKMTKESIINNMITFLIAGHETTSGLLSFLFYYLIKNPKAYQAAQAEVDKVVGRGPIKVDQMSHLPYLTACLRETLRLTPTAPAFSVQMRQDLPEESTLIGGKYEIKKGQGMIAVVAIIQKDPKVYGDDAEAFRPERMLDEAFAALPPNSWKPFGNGARGCIGRPFAWQEALLAVAMLLQNFNFRLDDPSYTLQIQQTLTIKPKDFYMHATLRDHIDVTHLEKALLSDSAESSNSSGETRAKAQRLTNGKSKKPMTVLYGSNSGTCEALASSLARSGGAHGYDIKVNVLDSAVDKLPKNEPVVVICSSYEGQPPDNAAHFVEWLSGIKEDKALEGLDFAVYGCGNHDWVSTFHRIPKLINSKFAEHGAKQIAEVGLGDVAAGDIFNDFDAWQDETFWPSFGQSKTTDDDVEDELQIDVDTKSRKTKLRQDVQEAVVVKNELLTPADSEARKRHITLKLPSGMNYKVGDYIAILPLNPSKTVHRVLKRFGLPWDAMLTVKAGTNTTLPTDHPISAMDLLTAYVELSQPATRKNIQKIASSIPDETERTAVMDIAGSKFETEVATLRRSTLDILEKHASATLPLASFLAMLPPMRIRQYSISSSPLADPTVATLSWTVLDRPSKAGDEKRFLGVASNYLSDVEPDDHVHIAVKPSHSTFRPPSDIEKTPVIMLCAGSGLAPFRGFVQERAIQHAAGRRLAPAYLFIGCTAPVRDEIFRTELLQWQATGVVKLYYAYSREPTASKGCAYVQDRLYAERDEMTRAFNDGAKVYICGSAKVGEGVAATIKRIAKENAIKEGKEGKEEAVEAWFQSIKADRYASDVFV